ncbi:MAG: 4Fe-4S binding protein, partial [Desulfobacteraceae bacterium]|nr:4Fe-4S binding protein [Desulfobacteraceae bacterium]
MTVLLFVPWFSWFTSSTFGVEIDEFESEVAVTIAFLVLGSFWCGWLCPFGNVNYFITKIGKNLFPSLQFDLPKSVDKVFRYLKYVFLAAFIYVILTEQIDYFFGDHMIMYKSTVFTTIYI